jgi:hypothetical protein
MEMVTITDKVVPEELEVAVGVVQPIAVVLVTAVIVVAEVVVAEVAEAN